MKLTILGSGGCMVIPKPLCGCAICCEARRNGPPFERTGPSAFLADINLLIDTPADIIRQLNRSSIEQVEHLMFTHLDPDHIEGFRVVEQIANDYRDWKGYPEKRIRLVLPRVLLDRLYTVKTVYGSQVEYYEERGFITCDSFDGHTTIGEMEITALPVQRGNQVAFVYVFETHKRKMVYAPCDIKPFPETSPAVLGADLLVIQPGIIEGRLKHQFVYPEDHISRKTLYTLDETLALSRRIKAEKVLFVHLEEYWNRSHADYLKMQNKYDNVQFAYDGMDLKI